LSDNETISRRRSEFVAAFNREDIAGMEDCVTDDVLALPPQHDAVRGKAAVRAFWGEGIAAVKSNLTIAGETLQIAGDTAIDEQRWTMEATPRDGGKTVHDAGKAIWIWRREQDGAWRQCYAIWNSDVGQAMTVWTGAPTNGPASAELSRADVAAIHECFSIVEHHVTARNYSAWANCFTPDAVFMFAHSREARGRAAIEEWGRSGPKVDRLSFSDVQIHGCGDGTAWATSAYELRIEGVAEPDVGKQLVVFKRQDDGSWLVQAGSVTSDLPPPGN
jgi:ketosteroid isomerase-like protein